MREGGVRLENTVSVMVFAIIIIATWMGLGLTTRSDGVG